MQESGNARNKAYVGERHLEGEGICVTGLYYRYPDGTLALEDINLHAHLGTTLAVIGPNGGGKTTLLKVLLGLLKGYEGEVLILGHSPERVHHMPGFVSWVPQRQRVDWDFPASLRQVVQMGLISRTRPLRPYTKQDLAYVEELMEAVGIRELAPRPIGALSGGQQQRMMIARALAARPRILMLDEPTVGVDVRGQEQIMQLLDDLKRRYGLTLVIVSHDLVSVISHAEAIACLDRTLHFHDERGHLTPEAMQRAVECGLDVAAMLAVSRAGDAPGPDAADASSGGGNES